MGSMLRLSCPAAGVGTQSAQWTFTSCFFLIRVIPASAISIATRLRSAIWMSDPQEMNARRPSGPSYDGMVYSKETKVKGVGSMRNRIGLVVLVVVGLVLFGVVQAFSGPAKNSCFGDETYQLKPPEGRPGQARRGEVPAPRAFRFRLRQVPPHLRWLRAANGLHGFRLPRRDRGAHPDRQGRFRREHGLLSKTPFTRPAGWGATRNSGPRTSNCRRPPSRPAPRPSWSRPARPPATAVTARAARPSNPFAPFPLDDRARPGPTRAGVFFCAVGRGAQAFAMRGILK